MFYKKLMEIRSWNRWPILAFEPKKKSFFFGNFDSLLSNLIPLQSFYAKLKIVFCLITSDISFLTKCGYKIYMIIFRNRFFFNVRSVLCAEKEKILGKKNQRMNRKKTANWKAKINICKFTDWCSLLNSHNTYNWLSVASDFFFIFFFHSLHMVIWCQSTQLND